MDGEDKVPKIYKCKRTINRKKKKFVRDFFTLFGRLPTTADMPTYRLEEQENANDAQSASSNAGSREAVSDSSQQSEEMDEESESVVGDSNDGNNGNNDDDDGHNDADDCITDLGTVHLNIDDDDDDDDDDGDGDDDGGGGDGDNYGDDDTGSDSDIIHEGSSDEDGDDDGDGDVDDNGGDNGNNDNDEDITAFSIQEGPLITMRPNVREHEILIAIMAVGERHEFSLESILAVINLFKKFANHNTLPTTKTGLWKKLGRNEANSQKRYLYCKTCKAVIGIGKVPGIDCPCGDAGPEKPLSMVSFFIKLDVTKQLKRIFSIPNIWHLLDYRNNRQKINPYGIEDLFDGESYIKLRKDGEFLSSNLNFSLTINTDGCQVAVSSKESAWPILLSINELSPHARKCFIILAGIWVDKEHPDLNIFMPPIIEELRLLYFTGIEWRPNGLEKLTSKFITNICTSDTPARAKMLNTTSYNGEYGCNFCYAPGIVMENGSRKYPIDDIVNRTDTEIRQDMAEATRTGIRQRGFIGDSTLKYLPGFDLRRGVVVDSMHCVDIGVVKKLTEMIIFGQLTDNWFRANARIRRIIEERLKKIRTPSAIARKPRPIQLWKLWKATEWRNWLLYYCIPCLKSLIPEEYFRLFSMLSEAMHVLNGDTITPEQLERARALINDFEAQYEQIFEIENMTTNMHLLRHLPDVVKCWGPLWAHNAYAYESFNHKILKSLNSSTGRQLQIINRYLLKDFIKSVSSNPNVNLLAKHTVKNILNTGKRVPVRNDVDYEHYYDFRSVGKHETRNLYDWESNVLHEEGLAFNNRLTVFKKCIVKGIMYTSKYSDKGDTRSCDKYVYTKDGKFAEILNIVSIVTNDGDQVRGMFVKWFENSGDIPISRHIKSLSVSTKGFIKVQDVRLPTIIVKINGVIYGVKMANAWDTD